MAAVAYPFLRLGGSAVMAGPWRVSVGGDAETVLADRLDHWDNATAVLLRREVQVDMAEAAHQLQIAPDGLGISVVVSLGTGGSRGERSRRVVWSAPFSAELSSTDIEIRMGGEELSQSLSLSTEVVLSADCHGSRLSPARNASRLWRDHRLVHLEPETARFPMETISFRNLLRGLGQDALFFVDGSNRPREGEFSSTVRLYLNADHGEFVERVSQGDPHVLQLLGSEVIGQLVRPALYDDEFAPEGAPTGSVSHVIAGWMDRAFPGYSLNTVRSLLKRDPARFEAALGSLAVVGSDDA